MHSSTNTILKKNKLKQPRREDEVVLTIPSLTFTLRRGGGWSAGTFWVVPGCHLGGFLAMVTRLCSCVLPYIQAAPVTTRGFVLLSRLCLSSDPGCKPAGLLFACRCCREGPLSGWPVTIQFCHWMSKSLGSLLKWKLGVTRWVRFVLWACRKCG